MVIKFYFITIFDKKVNAKEDMFLYRFNIKVFC